MPKILVAYHSVTGKTKKCCEILARKLGEKGFEVDLKPINEATRTSGYDLILVAFPVHCRRPSRPAQKWLREADLKDRKIALFCTYSLHGDKNALSVAEKIVQEKGGQVVCKASVKTFMSKPTEEKLSGIIECIENIFKV